MGTFRRVATSSSATHTTRANAGLEPTRHKDGIPPIALTLLCALAPGQNVVEMVDCGLRLAASYASLMPTQNPIDP
jgi:hypothetical protein